MFTSVPFALDKGLISIKLDHCSILYGPNLIDLIKSVIYFGKKWCILIFVVISFWVLFQS